MAHSFNELIDKQLKIEAEVQKLWINFTKDSSTRYSEEYFNKRLESLQGKWIEFQSNDEKLCEIREQNPQHDYFVKSFFDQMDKKCDSIRSKLVAELQQIQDSDVTASTSKASTRADAQQKGHEPTEQNVATNENGINEETRRIAESRKNLAKIMGNVEEAGDEGRRVTALRNNLSRILGSIDLRKSKVFLKFKADQLSACWANITSYYEEVIIAGNEDDEDFKMFTELEQIYEDAYVAIHENINFQNPEDVPNNPIRLPAINIPIFAGKYEEWMTFWELFEKLVHQNSRLTEVEKMQYLKSNVRGEAARIMGHLAVTSGNYLTAIKLLTNRFQNKSALVNGLIQKLLNLRPVRSENANDLKAFMDSAREVLYGISNLGVDVTSWDAIIIQLLLPKLDVDTRKMYIQSQGVSTEIPKLCDMFDFFEARFRALENSKDNVKVSSRESSVVKNKNTTFNPKNHVTTVPEIKCSICKGEHSIYRCKELMNMEIHGRREKVRHAQLCFNCLKSGHMKKDCSSNFRCSKCGQKHHSLLHVNNTSGKKINSTEVATTCQKNEEKTVLLATLIVNVCVKQQVKPIRALLDQGSQSCVITEELAKSLKVPLLHYETHVNGINNHSTHVVAKCIIEIQSIHDNHQSCKIEAIVMPRITGHLPASGFIPSKWPHIKGLQLADPWYFEPKEIQLLIGSDALPDILEVGLIKGSDRTPMAQNTRFGWVLSGAITVAREMENSIVVNTITASTRVCKSDENLKKFWELEEVPNLNMKTNEEQACEELYDTTHSRDEGGRYTVRLPFRLSRVELGNSEKMALKRFFSLEERFNKNPGLKKEYSKFIKEYIELGHMEEVNEAMAGKTYYLPHHAVIKKDSTTTKLRVVFDASANTSTGASLNSIMLTGPKLQQDLLVLLLQWRTYPVVFTADIEKMYRQIFIHEDDRDLQRIFWRDHPDQKIKKYRLKTVTYGTAAAPYLAIKTLMQLAEDEKHNFPLAYETLAHRFYVDDCLGGADSVASCKLVQQELVQLLRKGGFNLRKWTSNRPEVLSGIPKQDIEMDLEMNFDHGKTVKILGIKWCPKHDHFEFTVNIGSGNAKITKRSILSDAGKIFDPFGWLSPVTIKAKMMIQKLWLLNIGWDAEIPTELKKEWQEFKSRLMAISKIKIPRWTQQHKNSMIELHGYADASQIAYAAVVYAKVINEDKVTVSLIASKTKAAPIQQVSLARLELCAVALLTKLLKYIKDGAKLECQRTFIWSDSKIVLSWLKQHPTRWTTFVANRVSYIQQNFNGSIRFVPGIENPADIPSRGLFGDELDTHLAWWHGPEWLSKDEESWPQDNHKMEAITSTEMRKIVKCNLVQVQSKEDITMAYSSLGKLRRVMAYCLRFVNNCRNKGPERNVGYLTTDEFKAADKYVIKLSQLWFEDDIKQLKTKGYVKKSSSLYSLNPFVDNDGLLRVGGRLKHALMSNDQRHPIILHHSCPLSRLVINESHKATLHGGIKLTLNQIRNKFWIVRGTVAVKSYIRKCVQCFRLGAKVQTQLMGQLPEPRVNYTRPFTHCGVDYAGPIHIKCSQFRGIKSYKCYIVIFVCLATKAVHIELTSDLTTEGFLAALKRMVSRRGAVLHLYSDNGTNFVGANNTIQKLQVQNHTSEIGIRWHFIPPASPHFGGLWESGVKSIKHHLYRIVGEQKFTYEEMNTILVQIEGCLNSRPLCPLTDNIDDINALTPGHFLVGSNLMVPAHDVILESAGSSFQKWKTMQKVKQDLCNQWYKDYVKSIKQQVNKWAKRSQDLRVGQLVLLKDESISSAKWPLGRIAEVHPGADGLVRVVTVKTQKGIAKRSIQKVCLLPLEDNSSIEREPHNPQSSIPNKEVRAVEKKRTKKSTPVSIGSTLIMALLVLSQVTPSFSKYTITDPGSGVLIEHLGTARIQRGVLRTVTRFPVADIEQDEVNLNRTVEQMNNLCEKAKSLTIESQCNELMHHMKEEWRNLHESLSRLTQIRHRQKRGIFGNLLTSIFGVNDEVYHDIDALSDNQKILMKSTTSNTKLMLSTIAAMNETEQKISNKIMKFTEKLNAGIQAINNMDSWYKLSDANQVNVHLINTFLLANSYFKEIEAKYAKLLNAYLKRGHLYEFLSHQRVNEITQNCTLKLGHNFQVQPDPLDKLEFSWAGSDIIINGYFLITDTEEYDLMNLNSVPAYVSDVLYDEIETTSSIFGVNFNVNRYFESSMDNVIKAARFNDTTFYLQPSIFFDLAESKNCILQQIYKKLTFKKCTTHAIKVKNTIWKELWTKNAWLFITPPTTIHVTCGTEREEVLINATGLIHITPDCTIQSRYIRLEAKIEENMPVVVHYTKPMITVNSNLSVHTPIEIANETMVPLFDDLNSVLHDNKEATLSSLRELHDMHWKSIWEHQSWSIKLIYIMSGVVALLIVYTVIRIIMKRWAKRSESSDIQLTDINTRSNKPFEITW